MYYLFQSTHPMKGATIYPYTTLVIILFQSTHPVKGATMVFLTDVCQVIPFQSTHTVKGATTTIRLYAFLIKFQSTHPMKGATLFKKDKLIFYLEDFNPRTL